MSSVPTSRRFGERERLMDAQAAAAVHGVAVGAHDGDHFLDDQCLCWIADTMVWLGSGSCRPSTRPELGRTGSGL